MCVRCESSFMSQCTWGSNHLGLMVAPKEDPQMPDDPVPPIVLADLDPTEVAFVELYAWRIHTTASPRTGRMVVAAVYTLIAQRGPHEGSAPNCRSLSPHTLRPQGRLDHCPVDGGGHEDRTVSEGRTGPKDTVLWHWVRWRLGSSELVAVAGSPGPGGLRGRAQLEDLACHLPKSPTTLKAAITSCAF